MCTAKTYRLVSGMLDSLQSVFFSTSQGFGCRKSNTHLLYKHNTAFLLHFDLLWPHSWQRFFRKKITCWLFCSCQRGNARGFETTGHESCKRIRKLNSRTEALIVPKFPTWWDEITWCQTAALSYLRPPYSDTKPSLWTHQSNLWNTLTITMNSSLSWFIHVQSLKWIWKEYLYPFFSQRANSLSVVFHLKNLIIL